MGTPASPEHAVAAAPLRPESDSRELDPRYEGQDTHPGQPHLASQIPPRMANLCAGKIMPIE
jgi:hypothetical protein